MTDADENVVVGWRMKDRYRFRNPDLVAIRYATECREVFDIHEAICDLIDEERSNRIRVSPLTIATMIHDFPEGPEWEARHVAAFEGLRERGLIEFGGDVTLYGELVISLPERVYRRWHEAGKTKAANARATDPSTGRFVKVPALTTDIPGGSPVVPDVVPGGPLKDKGKDKEQQLAAVDPPKARSVAGQIQSARHELQSHASASIDAMIGRRHAQTDRMLSDRELLDEYWKPALLLRHQHGGLRLREALNRAAKGNAVRLAYIEPILADAQAAAASHAGTPEWIAASIAALGSPVAS